MRITCWKYSLWFYTVCKHQDIACENSRRSSLHVTGDVSRPFWQNVSRDEERGEMAVFSLTRICPQVKTYSLSGHGWITFFCCCCFALNDYYTYYIKFQDYIKLLCDNIYKCNIMFMNNWLPYYVMFFL